MIKLTSLTKHYDGYTIETEEYVNPTYIKTFNQAFHDEFKMYMTYIYWSIGGHNPMAVKETPEQIVELINKTK